MSKVRGHLQGVIVIRILTGAVFIFSGFVKAVDPLGSAFKFNDYFTAFQMDFMLALSLPLAIAMSGFEFIVGISLLFSLRIREGTWGSLLLMIFFTPLTLILAINNPVSDCGCFGDAIVLTNWQTFFKNLIISALVLIAFLTRNYTTEPRRAVQQWAVLFIFATAITAVSAHALRHLPLIDFRPYSTGSSISGGMIIPEGAEPDIFETTLIYEKDGVEKEFGEDNFPWQDSSWHFVSQESVLIKEGYRPPVHDFSIIAADGEDFTYQVLDDPGYSFLLVSTRIEEADRGSLEKVNMLALELSRSDVSFYGLSASPTEELFTHWYSMDPAFDFYSCDATCLKTIIRSNPGLILLKEGTVIAKWAWRDIPEKTWIAGKYSLSLL